MANLQNWKECKLGDFVTLNYGKSLTAKKRIEGDIPVYSSSGCTGSHNAPLVDSVGIIVGRKGTVGSVYKTTGPFYCIDTAYYITPDHSKYNFNFLYYLLQGLGLKNLNFDSAVPGLNRNIAYDQDVLLPPLEEQKAIASILSALDDKIENNLQMNKTLEEMAMTIYKHWFVDFGPFQDGEFVDSELGEIPKGWEVKELSDLINLNPRLKLTKGIEASFVEMKALPIDVMSVSQIASKKFKGGTKFQNGDTLFARITPCLENGKTAFVDFLDNDEIAFGSTEFLVMRAKKGVSKYWTYCLARERNFRLFSISTTVGTSGRQRVQNDPFLSYQLAVPSMEVYSEFTENVEPWFQKIRTNTLENKTLTQLRDTLLPKLISGEVRVKDVEKTLSEVL